MPRPKRPRHIMGRPSVRSFTPETGTAAETISLTHEELETIRLIDYQGMDQSQAAELMNVSRQTVGRILKAARFKMSKTLVEGCSLKIEGGCYRMRSGQGGGQGGHGRGRGKGRGCGLGRGSGRPD